MGYFCPTHTPHFFHSLCCDLFACLLILIHSLPLSSFFRHSHTRKSVSLQHALIIYAYLFTKKERNYEFSGGKKTHMCAKELYACGLFIPSRFLCSTQTKQHLLWFHCIIIYMLSNFGTNKDVKLRDILI